MYHTKCTGTFPMYMRMLMYCKHNKKRTTHNFMIFTLGIKLCLNVQLLRKVYVGTIPVYT